MAADTNPTQDALAKLRINRDADERPRSGRRRSFSKLFVFLVLLLLIATACLFAVKQQGLIADWITVPEAIRPRTEVRAATVVVESGRSADALVVATGYLESRRQAKIGARATGRIDKIHIEEGSNVKDDEILAVLEHADLDASLAASKATLSRSKAELVEQQIEIARTERAFARAETLFADNSLSEADFDIAKYEHDGAIARSESLKAAVELSEARVREAEQLKENMFFRAPFHGTAISKDAEVGESIMPGGMGEASGRGSVATIADLEHLQVKCDVKEDYIARVKPGQSAEVAVDAVPDHRYSGRVRKIIPMGDRARATIKVQVEILDVDKRLFPEMSSTVFFLPDQTAEVDNEEPRVFCRNAAIATDDTGNYVWVVDDEDRLQRVNISVAGKQDGRTEIAEGLTGGEQVVLNPEASLSGGQLVKIAE